MISRRTKRTKLRAARTREFRRGRYLPPWIIFDSGERRYTKPGDPKDRFHARRLIATKGRGA